MDVKLSDDNMKDIIAKAVLDTLTPESRAELISTAVKSLLTTPTGNHYDKKSPLQSAFDSAVREVAAQIAREQIVGNSEVKEKITALIAAAWERVVAPEGYSKLVDRVAASIEKGLTGDSY